MHKVFLALLSVLSVGCVTTPSKPDSAEKNVAANGTAVADAPKLVCRWEQEIGSNVRRKVCVPADELDDAERDAADDLRQMQNRTTRIQAPPPTPTGR